MVTTDDAGKPGAPGRPWRAALLTVLAFGLGHVYAGDLRRGVLAWLLFTASALGALTVLMLLPPRIHFVGMISIALGLPIAIVWDAVRIARLQPGGG